VPREEERRPRLLRRREAEHREREAHRGDLPHRGDGRLEVGEEDAVDLLARRERRDADGRLRDHAEPPLAPEDELAQVGPGGGGGERRKVEAPRRRLDAPPGEEPLDPPVAERLLAAGAGRDPAAERRELERLREVPERETARAQLRLEVGPLHARAERRQPARLVEREEPREAREVDRDDRLVRGDGVDVSRHARPAAVRHEAVPGPAGAGEERGDLLAALGEGDGVGVTPTLPERSATQSGRLCPRA
jgi:hypothetical protein